MNKSNVIGGLMSAVAIAALMPLALLFAQTIDPETRAKVIEAARLADIAERHPTRNPTLSEAVALNDWQVLSGEFGISGFRNGYYRKTEFLVGPDRTVEAYVVRRGGVVAIVFPGAREPVDFFDAVNGHMPQFTLLDPLFNSLESYVNNPANGVTEVLVVGHSLGGGIAEAYLHTHANDLNVPVSGVVFGSIGTDIPGQLATEDLISIRHLGDPVNQSPQGFVRAGQQIDLVYTDDPSIEAQHAMSSYLKTALRLSDSGGAPLPPPPTEFPNVAPGATIPAPEIWPITTATPTFWLIYDATGEAGSGFFGLPDGAAPFVWAGNRWMPLAEGPAVPAGTIVAVSAADFANLNFVGGTGNGITDRLAAAPFINGWQSWETREIMTLATPENTGGLGGPGAPPPPPAL